jgi:hypothetical protein
LPDIIRLIKWSRMRWAGDTAHMGRQLCSGSWLESLKEGDHFEDWGTEWRIILK